MQVLSKFSHHSVISSHGVAQTGHLTKLGNEKNRSSLSTVHILSLRTGNEQWLSHLPHCKLVSLLVIVGEADLLIALLESARWSALPVYVIDSVSLAIVMGHYNGSHQLVSDCFLKCKYGQTVTGNELQHSYQEKLLIAAVRTSGFRLPLIWEMT